MRSLGRDGHIRNNINIWYNSSHNNGIKIEKYNQDSPQVTEAEWSKKVDTNRPYEVWAMAVA